MDVSSGFAAQRDGGLSQCVLPWPQLPCPSPCSSPVALLAGHEAPKGLTRLRSPAVLPRITHALRCIIINAIMKLSTRVK